MNLLEQVNRLKILNDRLVLRSERRSDNTVLIRGWLNLSNVLNRLKDFSYLKEQVGAIFAIDENINIRIDEWVTKPATLQSLEDRIATLKKTIEACIKLIIEYTEDNLVISEGEGLINTKMPDNIDMPKMAIICNDLDKVFNQCPLIKEEIKFVGVEKGSVFFVFATTLASICILGKILNMALDVQKKYYQNEMLKNKLETMENLKDSIKPIIENLENEVKEYCKDKATQIEESRDLDNEEKERLALSIKTLSKLIGQGVQMQCVLYGEEKETNVSFPKQEDFKSLIDGIKLLSQN